MNTDIVDQPGSRPMEIIFKEHLDNTIECGNALNELFLNLTQPDEYISKVKHLEEKGDRLTAEAYCSLESLTYSEYIYITEQLVKRLDDIVDGINDTARLIDICHPRMIENAAHEILSALVSMTEKLQTEIAQYPDIELASIRACCKALNANRAGHCALRPPRHDRSRRRFLLRGGRRQRGKRGQVLLLDGGGIVAVIDSGGISSGGALFRRHGSGELRRSQRSASLAEPERLAHRRCQP